MTDELTVERVDRLINGCSAAGSIYCTDKYEAISLLAAARKSLSAGWRLIETAPRDSTKIDLWVVSSGSPEGYRITNASRIYDGGRWPDAWSDREGKSVNGSWFIDDEGDECFERGQLAHAKARRWSTATHWQPLPEPPK